MAISSQFLSLSSHSPSLSPSPSTLYFSNSFSRNPCSSLRFAPSHFPSSLHFQVLDHKIRSPVNSGSIDGHRFISRASTSGEVGRRGHFNIDSLLSSAELSFFVAALLASCVGLALDSVKACSGSVFLAVVGVAIGSWIRRLLWIRIDRETVKKELAMNLVERTNELQGDFENLALLFLELKREQNELQIRFNLNRRALMKHIMMTVASSRRTSAGTQALRIRVYILLKEIAGMQIILQAMQEHQQKQLDLILTFGKSAKR